jgi:hypothetical protein
MDLAFPGNISNTRSFRGPRISSNDATIRLTQRHTAESAVAILSVIGHCIYRLTMEHRPQKEQAQGDLLVGKVAVIIGKLEVEVELDNAVPN